VRTRHAIALVAALALFGSGCTGGESSPSVSASPVQTDRLVPLVERELIVSQYTELPTVERYPDWETFSLRTLSYFQQLATKAKLTKQQAAYMVIRPGEAVRCGVTAYGGGSGSIDQVYHFCDHSGTILINLAPLAREAITVKPLNSTFRLLRIYVTALSYESGFKRHNFCLAGVLLKHLEVEGDLTAQQVLDGMRRFRGRTGADPVLHGYDTGTCPTSA
jgi:hypothetical protein